MSDSQQDQYLNPSKPDAGVIVGAVRRHRAFLLLLALFFQILLMPIGYLSQTLLLILREIIVIAAVVMVSDNKRHLTIGLSLGLPSFIMFLVSHGTETEITDWIAYLMALALYLYVIKRLLNKVFTAKFVTTNTIAMALCTYLLIGQVWMLFYVPVAFYDPNSFTQPIAYEGSKASITLTYFSYVTLTTLGYGDISPASPLARSLAILEALTGTLFLAVLISRLVATYRSQEDIDGADKLLEE